MPLDPTLEGLSDQQAQLPPRYPQQLPPQLPWSQTPTGESLTGLGQQAGRAGLGAVKGFNDMIGQMATGSPEEQGRASGQFIETALGAMPFGGVEEGALGALRLSRTAPPNRFGYSKFNVFNESGKNTGFMTVNHYPSEGKLHVNWLSALGGSNRTGLAEIRTLLPEIEREYPDVHTITAHRAGGAHAGSAASDEFSKDVTITRDNNGKWRIEAPEKLKRVETPEKLKLVGIPKERAGGMSYYDIVNAAGARVGNVNGAYDASTRNFHITDMNALGGSNDLGYMRNLAKELRREFPGIATLSGRRMGGAQQQVRDVVIEIKRLLGE